MPGTEFRIATISGSPMGDSCERAKKMIEEIVGEVRTKDLNVIHSHLCVCVSGALVAGTVRDCLSPVTVGPLMKDTTTV